MFKKTLISLAVASSLGLTGCFDSGDRSGNANPEYSIDDTTIDRSLVRPIFDPNPLSPTFSVPAHFDLVLLLEASQETNHDFTAPASGDNPSVAAALSKLSGFSTSSAFNVKFDGELDPDSVRANESVQLRALNTCPTVASAPGALPSISPDTIKTPDKEAPCKGSPFAQTTTRFTAEAVSVDKGTNNAIRITPLEPLEEGTKYLVVVSDGVKGANDKPVDQSVAARNIAEGALGNDALSNVQNILTGTNELASLSLSSTGDDVALAYTFTTNSDTDVLRAMASPLPFLESLGEKIGFTAQLKAIRDNYPDLPFAEQTEKLAEIGAKAVALQEGQITAADLTATELAAVQALGVAGSIVEEIPAAIEAQVGSTLHVAQPRPYVNLSHTDAQTIPTVAQLGAGNPIYDNAEFVTVSQGAITLPSYQSIPEGEDDGDTITSAFWEGNTDLESALNDALSPTDGDVFQFLRDNDGSLTVNGNFPFPQQKGSVTVPVTIFRPKLGPDAPASCDHDNDANTPPLPAKGITIFQHGIGVDRSTAMLPGIMLASSQCQAVVAIDQPLHGLAGDSAALPGSNPGTLPGLTALDDTVIPTLKGKAEAVRDGYIAGLTGNGLDPTQVCPNTDDTTPQSVVFSCLQINLMNQLLASDYFGERHFDYTRDTEKAGVEAKAEADIANISSGSLFINPLNMLNSRDNLRQSVVDLLNIAASVKLMPVADVRDANGDPGTDGLDDPIYSDVTDIHFVGHSLGGISGTVFASLANDPTVQLSLDDDENQIPSPAAEFLPTLTSAVLHNTGGQVTRLLENSQSRSDEILGGLAANGIDQKTSNYENFFYIFQSLVDSTDPVNFASNLGTWTQMNLVDPDGSPMNLLVTEVVDDDTVPNEANVNPLGEAYKAPLAGTEPLMAILDLGAQGGTLANGAAGLSLVTSASAANEGAVPAASFFAGGEGQAQCSQANHGTFVAPRTPADPDASCPNGSDTSAAFAEMVRQTALALNGVPVLLSPAPDGSSADLNVLGSSDTIENALDQDEIN